jgi:ABC-type Fe3+/spermidine/putrescine transport system ATPase subunit
VALFIGDANLMEGTANADGVATPLGLLHRPTHHRGPVQVMLRPELIGLSPEPVADAVEGVVEGIDFFGHDYVAKVTIGGLAEPVQVRLLRFVILKPGQKVWLTLSGAGMVYPPAALPLRADSPVVG